MKKYKNPAVRKTIFTLLIYISLGFLIVYLREIDYLHLKELQFKPGYLVASLLFLFSGFLVSAMNWYFALKRQDVNCSIGDAIISHGLHIFSKYIPGKLWTIIGRAGIMSSRIQRPIGELSLISMKEQLVFIWTGMVLSIFLVYSLLDKYIIACYLIFLFVLTVFLFSKKFHEFIFGKINYFFKNKLFFPYIRVKKFYPVFFTSIIYWTCWMAGFYLLAISMKSEITNIAIAFIFPYSAVLGLLAIFVPGGLGVREGLMVIALISMGLAEPFSTTFAVISRIWFIIGELFIFIVAFFIRAFKK